MRHPCQTRCCPGCAVPLPRRDFIKGCGAALATASGLAPRISRGDERDNSRVRVGLVFLSRAGVSWPYPEFDVIAREKEILGLLAEGCPQIEFVPVAVRNPEDVQLAVSLKDQVDGYFVYAVTLAWNLTGSISTLGNLGKPMIVADEILGGSGMFLTGYSGLRREGRFAAGVATTQPKDLITVARLFMDVKKPGASPESFARQCDEVYRKTFPPAGNLDCIEDPVPLTDIRECIARFQDSRFLIVGRNQKNQEHNYLGAKGIDIGFDEFNAFYDQADRNEANELADRWIQDAERVVETTVEVIRKSAAVYLATRALLRQYGTDTVTMNCLGGFASGKLPALPCLGFMELLNEGGHGICEAMPDDTLSFLMARILTGRPGYVSDPVLDTSKNHIIYAHCMATTKVFGPESESNMFRIRTLHNRDPRACCVQSFLPEGYMTTSFRTNFARKEMVIHQAKTVGNLDSQRGCRTQLIGEVRGDIGKLFYQWDRFGWHRVTVYGDVQEPLIEFGKALGLDVIVEA
ncbi:MAG: hypothetical protein JW829_01180 [Pirellulales bacterium]|nr:hypothetical protein [Pirellulales bacterium]